MKKLILLFAILIIVINLHAQCWKTASGGGGHSLAIRTDSTLWAWGWNAYGQVGDGSFTNRNIPVQIGVDSNWVEISAGDFHSLAIKADGTLWAWGRNMYGEVGDGGSTNRNMPVQIGTATNWKSVSAGGWHSLALKTDGTLWAWGSNFENANYYGQLGDGSFTNKHVPTQVGTASDWATISAGYIFNLAIKNNGTRWAWGANTGAYLGNGSYYMYENMPIQVGSEINWQTGGSGYAHTLSIKKDGTIWTWGLNYSGQIGDGTNNIALSPKQVGTDADWKMVAGATYHSLALKNDGTIWSWGGNDFGTLGDGTYDPSLTPIQIGIANDWKFAETGHVHNLAIKTDGTLWAWGLNADGQLGDSSFENKNVPTLILCRRKMAPITLSYFTAQKQKNTALLTWQTAMEQNSKEYQVERSADGIKFIRIGIVGSKNNANGSHYTYTDLQPSLGRNYYRLKAVDIDAKYTYSNINLLTFNSGANEVNIYPNPVKDLLTIESNFKAEQLNINITDLAGRILLKTVKPNDPLIEIPVDLKTGIYLLTIFDGKNTVSKKLVKE